MDKEKILKASREEHKNRDLAEEEIAERAGNIAGRVGVTVCLLISVISRLITGEYLLSPWAIYFSMAGTQWVVRAKNTKRRSDLVIAAFFAVIFLLLFVLIILKLLGVEV